MYVVNDFDVVKIRNVKDHLACTLINIKYCLRLVSTSRYSQIIFRCFPDYTYTSALYLLFKIWYGYVLFLLHYFNNWNRGDAERHAKCMYIWVR